MTIAPQTARAQAASAGPQSIQEMLAETRGKFGDRPALRDRVSGAWRHTTHAQVADTAANYGVGLLRLGVQPGDKFALIASNSIEWCVAWLGAAIVGAVNVPIAGALAASEINGLIKVYQTFDLDKLLESDEIIEI